MTQHTDFPRLIADIGGTNARFGLETRPFVYENIQVLACSDYPSLAAAATAYLSQSGITNKIQNSAIAVPAPVVDDVVTMVNNPWKTFSIKNTRKELSGIGIKNVLFLNDWHAMALAIPHIDQSKLVRIGGSREPHDAYPKAVIGPGTGIGMATLFKHPHTKEFFGISSEGGRCSFSPTTEEEVSLWRFAHKRFSHVSVERFVSGPGLELIYEALCHLENIPIQRIPTAAEITTQGIHSEDLICKRVVDLFCRMFGTYTANFAAQINAFGGIYIGGGIVPQILDYFVNSEFRSRFEAKGRYQPFLQKMPIYVILDKFPAFLGASYALDTYLTKSYVP